MGPGGISRGREPPAPPRKTLALPKHEGRTGQLHLAPSLFPPPPRPSLSGLVVVEQGEVSGQNEDFIYLFISISFALCLVPEFAGGARKREEKKSLCLCTNSHSEQETGRWLGTSFWGWGDVSRRHRICIEVFAGHQRGVRTQTLRFNCLKTHCHLPSTGGGVLTEHPKSSFTFLAGHLLWAPQLDRSTICLLSVQKLVLFLFFGHTTWFVGS